MSKKALKVVALMVTVMLGLSLFPGCEGSNQATKDTTGTTAGTAAGESSAAASQDYWDMLGTVKDTSDLPTWTGKQLKLVEWLCHGKSNTNVKKAETDIVGAEAKRVTGVELDAENSFDNGGQDPAQKITMLAASGAWPSFAFVSEPQQWKDLAANGKIYDLTDAIQKYCPDILKKMPQDKLPQLYSNLTFDGKLYFIPTDMSPNAYPLINPDVDKLKFSSILPPSHIYDYTQINVRDDLLKLYNPNLLSRDEIDAAMLANGGKFTQEEVYDIGINSTEEFYKFLRDMQKIIADNKIMSNGKLIDVTYASQGSNTDTWELNSCLMTYIHGVLGGPQNNQLSYYDKSTGKITFPYMQPFFKDWMKEVNLLVRDNIMEKSSLIENNTLFAEKRDRGAYAVLYGWDLPDTTVLEKSGAKFHYRRIYINPPVQSDKYTLNVQSYGSGLNIAIFKDTVKEEDLPQVLRYINYMLSDVGENLTYWGPRSAGLFDDSTGIRVYKDKDLETNMVYDSSANTENMKYNLFNYKGAYWQQFPFYPVYMTQAGSVLHPRYVTPRALQAGDRDIYFNPGQLPGNSLQEKLKLVPLGQDMWVLGGKIPEIQKAFDGRNAVDDMIKKCWAAKDDAAFEAAYKSFLEVADKTGFNQANADKATELYLKENEGFLE